MDKPSADSENVDDRKVPDSKLDKRVQVCFSLLFMAVFLEICLCALI